MRFQDGSNKKSFQWWVLTDRGGWSSPKKLNVLVMPYGWQQLKGQTEIHLLNGEKAVDRAVQEWALAGVTCLPNGEGKWRDEYLPAFSGATRVYIIRARI